MMILLDMQTAKIIGSNVNSILNKLCIFIYIVCGSIKDTFLKEQDTIKVLIRIELETFK